MLSPENNALITQVEPGAPLHPLLKQYWIPAIRSAAVVAGGAPKRVKLLGERYVVFRGDDGRVGFLDERCPRRWRSPVTRTAPCAASTTAGRSESTARFSRCPRRARIRSRSRPRCGSATS